MNLIQYYAAWPQDFWNWLKYKILQVWLRRNYLRARMGFEEYMYSPTMHKFLDWAADLSKPIIKDHLNSEISELYEVEGLIDNVDYKKAEIREDILDNTLIKDPRIKKLDKEEKIMSDGSFHNKSSTTTPIELQNIAVSKKMLKRLKQFGSHGDSYEQILAKLMDVAEGNYHVGYDAMKSILMQIIARAKAVNLYH